MELLKITRDISRTIGQKLRQCQPTTWFKPADERPVRQNSERTKQLSSTWLAEILSGEQLQSGDQPVSKGPWTWKEGEEIRKLWMDGIEQSRDGLASSGDIKASQATFEYGISRNRRMLFYYKMAWLRRRARQNQRHQMATSWLSNERIISRANNCSRSETDSSKFRDS
jgi:hypothetical protein